MKLLTPRRTGAVLSSIPAILCLGNSLTEDVGVSAPLRYPSQLAALYGSNATVQNNGIGAQTTADILAAIQTQAIDYYRTDRSKNIAVVWEITNDLDFGSMDAATAYNTYVSLCRLLQTSGFLVCAVGVTPRSDAGTPASFEANRQTVTTSLRANHSTFSNAFYDPSADSRIGLAGCETDLTYYRGLVHGDLLGTLYGIIAAGVKAAIDPLL